MIKKLALAASMIGISVVGFAPQSSAQILACTDPETCGFINASGFYMGGFAGDSFALIGPEFPFFFAGTGGTPAISPTASTAATPVVAPAPNTGLGEWGLGSLPVNTRTSRASLPRNLRLADSTSAASTDSGFDAASVAPVVLGLMGLYGVFMFGVRRRVAVPAA